MSAGELLRELGRLRGGRHGLYKHTVRIDWYEHDDSAIVFVLGYDLKNTVLYESPEFFGDDAVERALAHAIQELSTGVGMAETKRKWGFFSEKAVAFGVGTSFYKTPDGGRVEVTAIDEDPEAKTYLWDDKRPVGEVTEYDGEGRPRSRRQGASLWTRLGNQT